MPCAEHQRQRRRDAEARRGSVRERGYNTAWERYSKAFLAQHPVCIDPFRLHSPASVAAECTDHIIPHKGDMALFWDAANHQALCLSCNAVKAARYEGGFGNGR